MKVIIIYLIVFLYINSLTSQNKFPFYQNKKWFYVDTTMKKVSKKVYAFLFPFQGNYAVAKQNDKYGVVDGNENVIISFQYDTIAFNESPPFYCIKNKQTVWLDTKEQPIVMQYGCGQSSSVRFMFPYKKNNKIGLLKFNDNNNQADSLPNIYDKLYEYYGGNAIVKVEKKWGTINSDNKTITPFILDSIQTDINFSISDKHKLVKYFNQKTIGFLNTSGVVITKPIYKDSYFTLGQFTLVLTIDNKLVYIDSKGRKYYK